ncbi:MAG TPA: ATP-binding protein, partial [Polyangiaceae bacterium]
TRVEIAGGFQLQATVRDISATKRTERALVASEKNYRALLDGAGEGVVVVSRHDRIVRYANQAACESFGYTQDEFLRMRAEQLHPKDFESEFFAMLQRGEALVRPRLVEIPCRRKDNSVFWSDIAVSPLEYDGRACILGFFHDATDRREVRERLELEQRQRQMLEVERRHAQKLEAIGQLAAGIAHEINTPSQFVSDSIYFIQDSFNEILKVLPVYRQAARLVERTPDGPELLAAISEAERDADIDYAVENLPQCFERCIDGVGRIASIVRAMKEFAHPGQAEKCCADLNQALLNTLAISRNEYKYVADVITELGALPPVMCSIGDINQVFLNLIVNAAHAIAAVVGNSGDKGTIRIVTSTDGASVEVRVSDTGCGVPSAIQQRIFEPFFTTKEVGKGSGQGLAIARNIVVDKHGGTLTFESVEGQGTTFCLRLPLDAQANMSLRAGSTDPLAEGHLPPHP